MKRILIIDTTSDRLRVIIFNEGNIYSIPTLNTKKHLETLLPQIEVALEKSCLKLKDIDCYAIAIGPGSFTGIRIGVSTVKGFMCVYKKECVEVNLFDLMEYIIKEHQINKKTFGMIMPSTLNKYYYKKISETYEQKSGILGKEEILEESSNCEIYSFSDCTGIVNVKTIELNDKDYIDYVLSELNKGNIVKNMNIRPVYMSLSQAEEELLKKEKINNG